jgi:ABC-2 type transport system ATP-binding protein
MIETTGIEKRYGRTVALHGVALSMGDGVTGILGPNGAGKTTFLRILATVMAPDKGTLRLLGMDPTKAEDRVDIRRRLGYFPQEPGLYPSFTAFEFVDYVAILKEMTDRRTRHDEVRRVLGLVGLTEVAGKKIKTLSGGMKRRVVLAQALLGDPDLLVLDEPTAGLDPEQRLRFRELLSDVSGDAVVVLSTHQTEDVAAVCHRVVVIHEGAVHFDGTTQALAELARDRVWLADSRAAGSVLSWRTADQRHRNIGDAPTGAELVEPTIDDGYLLLVGEHGMREAA